MDWTKGGSVANGVLRGNVMEYVHPQKYKGLKLDTPTQQAITKEYVEANCLRCDLFMGREHDFSECNRKEYDPNCTCPKECRKAVSLVDPYSFIKCKSK